MRLRWCAEISIVKVYGFTTQVLLVSVWPVVTAHTGEAVTGVEALNLLGTNLVDVDLAEVDVVDRPHRLVQIRREQVGGEAVRGVVGKLDGLLEIVKRLDREHRTEHLALHDVHVVSRTREHRWFEPVPLLELLPFRPSPAEHNFGSLLYSVRDEGLYLGQLGLVDLRAHLHVFLRRISKPQRGCRVDEALDELVVDAALHIGAFVAGAYLPTVPEACVDRVLDRGGYVGIVEDDERCLPAQLSRDRYDVLRGSAEDLSPTAYRAG